MNQQLENILKDLEYDKVFVKTIDEYDNKYLNEFEDWSFTKAYSFEKKKYIDIITFDSCYAWNEQIWDSIYDIRKRCLEKYGYDIIPLDFDMYSTFDFDDCAPVCNIEQKYIDKIRHTFNKTTIKCKYLIGNNKFGIMALINHEIYLKRKPIKNITFKLKRYQRYRRQYLQKYFDKKNRSFDWWTYYEIV